MTFSVLFSLKIYEKLALTSTTLWSAPPSCLFIKPTPPLSAIQFVNIATGRLPPPPPASDAAALLALA
jgi:hypothetical protein